MRPSSNTVPRPLLLLALALLGGMATGRIVAAQSQPQTWVSQAGGGGGGGGFTVAGAGLTASGNTVNAVAHADGSIIVSADDIRVGTISDAQHGTRGGGTTHAVAVAGVSAGFVSASDQTKLDALTTANVPSSGEKAALAGTSGTPGSGNKYVTDGDARNTNSRAPSGSASGDLTGSYPGPTLTTTGVSAATYTYATVAVDTKGRITSASNGTTPAVATRSISVAGDLTGGGDLSADRTITLPNTLTSKTVAVTDTTTNDFSTPLTIQHLLSSGTAAASMGIRMLMQLVNASGTTKDAGSIIAQWSGTPTAGSEKSYVRVRAATAGALADAAYFWGTGKVGINTSTEPGSTQGLAVNGSTGSVIDIKTSDTSRGTIGYTAGGNLNITSASAVVETPYIFPAATTTYGLGDATHVWTTSYVRQYAGVEQTVSYSSGTLALTPASGETIVVTLAASAGTTTLANGLPGEALTIIVVQNATGGWTITWPSNVKFPAATPPTLSAGANKIDVLNFVYRSGTSHWYYAGGQFDVR